MTHLSLRGANEMSDVAIPSKDHHAEFISSEVERLAMTSNYDYC